MIREYFCVLVVGEQLEGPECVHFYVQGGSLCSLPAWAWYQ